MEGAQIGSNVSPGWRTETNRGLGALSGVAPAPPRLQIASYTRRDQTAGARAGGMGGKAGKPPATKWTALSNAGAGRPLWVAPDAALPPWPARSCGQFDVATR